ncbi:MAG: hypothetical protein ACJA0W_000831 [Candidatus Azotimanducaceae bacterium]|jgi:hypothetical protein
MHKGQCLCGQIQYEFEGEPLMSGVCHCKNCQRQAGSAFSTISGVPKAALKLTGSPKLYQDDETDSGNAVERYFCGNCGSPIYSAVSSQPDLLFLKTGTLDDTASFAPQFQVYCETKQDWVALLENIPQAARGS